jgi:hypothetical protein
MTLVIGMAVGAASVALLIRLRAVLREEDPEALADRLEANLQELERRVEVQS